MSTRHGNYACPLLVAVFNRLDFIAQIRNVELSGTKRTEVEAQRKELLHSWFQNTQTTFLVEGFGEIGAQLDLQADTQALDTIISRRLTELNIASFASLFSFLYPSIGERPPGMPDESEYKSLLAEERQIYRPGYLRRHRFDLAHAWSRVPHATSIKALAEITKVLADTSKLTPVLLAAAVIDARSTTAFEALDRSVMAELANTLNAMIDLYREPCIASAGVYFAQLRVPGFKESPIKIGVTTNIGQRLMALNPQGGPYDIELLALIRGATYEVENALHRQFASLRIRNEWFRPGKELLAFIKKLKEKDAALPATVSNPSNLRFVERE